MFGVKRLNSKVTRKISHKPTHWIMNRYKETHFITQRLEIEQISVFFPLARSQRSQFIRVYWCGQLSGKPFRCHFWLFEACIERLNGCCAGQGVLTKKFAFGKWIPWQRHSTALTRSRRDLLPCRRSAAPPRLTVFNVLWCMSLYSTIVLQLF
jgi:hypothetical protein